MEISELQKKAHKTAVKRGQYDHNPDWAYCLRRIVDEVFEARTAHLEGKIVTIKDLFGKPEGLPSELADVILATLSVAEHFGIDMEAEIELKQRYNETRSD